MNNLNPIWNEEFIVEFNSIEDVVLIFHVLDYNRLKKPDDNGIAAFTLSECSLQMNVPVELTLHLHVGLELHGILRVELTAIDFETNCTFLKKNDLVISTGIAPTRSLKSIVNMRIKKKHDKLLSKMFNLKSVYDIVDELDTGDLLLYSDVHNAYMAAVQIYTRSMFSNIGIIIKNPSRTLRETFNLTSKDSHHNIFVIDIVVASNTEEIHGIRIRELVSLIEQQHQLDPNIFYAIRKLSITKKSEAKQIRKSEQLDWLASAVSNVSILSDKEYWSHTTNNATTTATTDLSIMLPGQLISKCLKSMGVLSGDTSHLVYPAHFTSSKQLKFTSGVSYQKEQRIKPTQSVKKLEQFLVNVQNDPNTRYLFSI
jgi:hypothetical protein